MRVFKEGGRKLFLLGLISGALMSLGTLFGIAAVRTIADWEELLPGNFEDVFVKINETPGGNFSKSLDIHRDGKLLARLGKRKSVDTIDRCQLFDPEGNILAHMVLADEEALPGIMLLNGRLNIASLTFVKRDGKQVLHGLMYGPYGFNPEKIETGDKGWVDMDVDGQFDVRDIFNDDGTIQKTFIFCKHAWYEAIEINRDKAEAIIMPGENTEKYKFMHGQGWQQVKITK